MICFGFVKSWVDLVPLRLVLGIFEAGFFPGCAYLLSCWYPRYDLQKRNAVFYLIGSAASAFSGILAYGFIQMNTLGGNGSTYLSQTYGPTKANPDIVPGRLTGVAGWRWMFIMQVSFHSPSPSQEGNRTLSNVFQDRVVLGLIFLFPGHLDVRNRVAWVLPHLRFPRKIGAEVRPNFTFFVQGGIRVCGCSHRA